MAKPYRLLITSAGSSTATNIVRALAPDERFEIHTADVNPACLLAVTRLGAVSHTVVPPASSGTSYITAVKDCVAEKSIDFVYPVHDDEIVALTADTETARQLRLPSNSFQAIENCSDKLKAAEICLRNDIPVPKTRKGTLDAITLPAFIKPRRGVGSLGAFLLENLHDAPASWADLIIQDVCEKPELTVDALFTSSGSTIAVARERLEVKAGVCIKARVFYDRYLLGIAEKIAKAFDLTGLICFQVMRGPDGWQVTDINPRCGGGTALTKAAGVDLYNAYFSEIANFDDFGAVISKISAQARQLRETIVVRYYDEIVSARRDL